MSLKEYRRKRDFRKTAEPTARRGKGSQRRFVIQKHDATRLHYDFRLEIDGTLKSWAVPKGIPYEHGEKRLAVHVEDHPVAYIDFEGTIPKGQYGGGTVMVWDHGTYEPLSKAPAKELAGGKLHFVLHGTKLEGEWYLVRLRDGDQWLLIRGGDSMKPVTKKHDDQSSVSGRTMKQLSTSKKVWESKPSGSKAKSAKVAPSRAKSPRAAAPNARKKAVVMPVFSEPMKAKLLAAPPPGDWIYEIKFDGWRALALKGGDKIELLSRNKKDLADKFPEIVEATTDLDAQTAILDGEIVALDKQGRSSFQLLQAYDIGEERPPLFFYVFDLLQLDGKDLRKEPIEKRKAELKRLLEAANQDILRFSDSLGTEAEPLLKQAQKLGLEGLIGKRQASHYESGSRSGAWIKLKLHREQEFVIGGYTEPEGSRKYFGSLIVGVYEKKDLICVGKVGTGFTHKLLKSLHADFAKILRQSCPFANLPADRKGKWGQGITAAEMKRCHWLQPSKVCQVKFGEWTRDNRLRQPVFLGLRKDKPAKDVIREKTS